MIIYSLQTKQRNFKKCKEEANLFQKQERMQRMPLLDQLDPQPAVR